MKLNKNLVLVGMMGVGKSSIGKILSKKLEFEFIDTDNKIEEMENKTIAEIFKINGEQHFRNIEEVISLKMLKLNNKVIALGGGGYTNPSIRKYTLKKCISIWLDCKSETIINRIKNSKKRPLTLNLKSNEMIKLIEERSKFYEKAHFKINCDKITKTEITNKILDLYEND